MPRYTGQNLLGHINTSAILHKQQIANLPTAPSPATIAYATTTFISPLYSNQTI